MSQRTSRCSGLGSENAGSRRSAAHHVLCEELGVRPTVPHVPFSTFKDDPLSFYREYVAMSQPVVLTGMVDHWPALQRWKGKQPSAGGSIPQGEQTAWSQWRKTAGGGRGINGEYLVQQMRTEEGEPIEVTVALTPTGWADAVTEVATLPCLSSSTTAAEDTALELKKKKKKEKEEEEEEGEEEEEEEEEKEEEEEEGRRGRKKRKKKEKEEEEENEEEQVPRAAKKEEEGPSFFFCAPAEERMALRSLFSLLRKAHLHVHQDYPGGIVAFNRNRMAITLQQLNNRSSVGDHVNVPVMSGGELATGKSAGSGSGNSLLLEDYELPCDVPIAYAQFQNSSLGVQFEPLKKDIDSNVKDYGELVFGTKCEAENMWIGGDGSVTSMHQDWFENFYVIVAGGSKIFHMIPPWEGIFLDKREFPDAEWNTGGGGDGDSAADAAAAGTSDDETGVAARKKTLRRRFRLVPQYCSQGDDDVDDTSNSSTGGATPSPSSTGRRRRGTPAVTPWIAGDVVVNPNPNVHQMTIELAVGEVLYLPPMWFHRVSHRSNCTVDDLTGTCTSPSSPHQTVDGCGGGGGGPTGGIDDGTVPAVVAVNYWFDMPIGPMYRYQEYTTEVEKEFASRGNP